MSYKIQYASSAVRIPLDDSRKKSVPKWFRWCSILMIVLSMVYLLQTKAVQNYLVPGNKEVTKAAWSQMNQSLKEGIPVSEAIQTFCRQIIEYSELS